MERNKSHADTQIFKKWVRHKGFGCEILVKNGDDESSSDIVLSVSDNYGNPIVDAYPKVLDRIVEEHNALSGIDDVAGFIGELSKQISLAKENAENAINNFDGHTISALKAKFDHIDYRLMEALSLFPKEETPADGEVKE